MQREYKEGGDLFFLRIFFLSFFVHRGYCLHKAHICHVHVNAPTVSILTIFIPNGNWKWLTWNWTVSVHLTYGADCTHVQCMPFRESFFKTGPNSLPGSRTSMEHFCKYPVLPTASWIFPFVRFQLEASDLHSLFIVTSKSAARHGLGARRPVDQPWSAM